jgi:hypothetical protein
MLLVLVTGAAFAFLYLLGQSGLAGPGSGSASPGVGRPTDALLLIVNYLGLPWARGIPVLGWMIGLGAFVLALAALAFKGGADAPWPERAAVLLILFSLVTAAMAGAARSGLIAPDMVPMRYAVFLIPMHVGLWILALPRLRRDWERRPKPMAGVVAAVAGLMLVHQGVMAVYAVRTADANLRVIADFRAGRRSAIMRTMIYSDLDKAQALSERLRREGLYQRELRPDPPPAH